jgi:hypothetical protein
MVYGLIGRTGDIFKSLKLPGTATYEEKVL